MSDDFPPLLNITPAGRDSPAFQSDLLQYLPLGGGTMVGNVFMDGHEILSLGNITLEDEGTVKLVPGTGFDQWLKVSATNGIMLYQSGGSLPVRVIGATVQLAGGASGGAVAYDTTGGGSIKGIAAFDGGSNTIFYAQSGSTTSISGVRVASENGYDFHLRLDDDDTYLTQDAVDQIQFYAGGTKMLQLVEDTTDVINVYAAVVPGTDNTYDLGNSSTAFGQIYAYGLNLEAIGTGDEGAQINMEGSGANPDWAFDVYQDSLRFFTGGVVYLKITDNNIVSVKGDFLADDDSLYDIGSSSIAWAEGHFDSVYAGGNVIGAWQANGDFALDASGSSVNVGSTGSIDARESYVGSTYKCVATVHFEGTGVSGGAAGADWKIGGCPAPANTWHYKIMGHAMAMDDSNSDKAIQMSIVWDAPNGQMRFLQDAGVFFYDNGDYFTIAAGDKVSVFLEYEV